MGHVAAKEVKSSQLSLIANARLASWGHVAAIDNNAGIESPAFVYACIADWGHVAATDNLSKLVEVLKKVSLASWENDS